MAETFFDFPTDKYPKSYSGPTQQFQGMLTGLLPQMQQSFQQFPEQQKEFYNQARTGIEQGYGGAISDIGKTYQNRLQPALQQSMNDLGRRGMLNSKVAGETMAGTARGIGQDVVGQQAQLQLAKQLQLAQLAQEQGQGNYQYPQLLSNLLQQGQYSESSDQLAPYVGFSNLLTKLMGY